MDAAPSAAPDVSDATPVKKRRASTTTSTTAPTSATATCTTSASQRPGLPRVTSAMAPTDREPVERSSWPLVRPTEPKNPLMAALGGTPRAHIEATAAVGVPPPPLDERVASVGLWADEEQKADHAVADGEEAVRSCRGATDARDAADATTNRASAALGGGGVSLSTKWPMDLVFVWMKTGGTSSVRSTDWG